VQSYDNQDDEATQKRAEAGIACGAQGEALGTLYVVKSLVDYWHGNMQAAYPMATEGVALSPSGSLRWAKGMSNLFALTSLLGQREHLAELVGPFLSTDPQPDAVTAYVEAAATQIVMFGVLGDRAHGQSFIDRMMAVGAAHLS